MPSVYGTSTRDADKRALRYGLQFDPLESPGITLSDEEVDAMIAETLAANHEPAAAPVKPEVEAAHSAARVPRDRSQVEDEACLDRIESYAELPGHPEIDMTPPRQDRPKRRRMLRRVAFLVLLVGAAYAWPLTMGLILLGLVWLALIAFILAGHDGVASACLGGYRWLDARWPDRAERLRLLLDRGALRLDAVLDRLPERWTAGLYLPDFSRENLNPDAFADRPDPFDRLSAEARGRIGT